MTFKRWIPTFLAFPIAGWVAIEAIGSSEEPMSAALAAVATGSGTDVPDLVVTGLVTGAAVGAAQGPLLARGARVAAAWTAITSAAWGLGWLTTSQVIVDAERGFHMFGSSGALAATVLTGLALRVLAGGARASRAAGAHAPAGV
jgi:hypothetical protein